MKANFETILDDCLAQLRAGSTVEDCLARYPEHADALQSLLTVAFQVHRLPAPAPDRAAMNAGRQRMIESVRAKTAQQRQVGLLGVPWFRWTRPLESLSFGSQLTRAVIMVALVLLVITLSTGGLVAAAQGSLPGDALYPLKRAAETARMILTLDPTAQRQLQDQFDQERQNEVRAVLTAGQPASLEFRGVLEHLEPGYWIVGGLDLHLDEQSIVEGRPVVGALVAVRADALGDGILLARRLQVESSPLVPSPTPTPTASPTPAPPTASATAMPSQTQEPTASPAPTATRQATPTASHTPTAVPQPQPQSTGQPVPTETREPESTEHPEPGETGEPEATHHPEPGETEEPESTDQPKPTRTEEVESTRQPRPSATDDDEDHRHAEPSQTGTPQPAPGPTVTPTEESDSSGQLKSAVAEWLQAMPAAQPTPVYRG